MAGFKTHSFVGAGVGVCYSTILWFGGTMTVAQAFFSSFLCAFASLLPDADCDTGRPRRIILDTLAIIVPTILTLICLDGLPVEERFFVMLIAFFCIRYPVAFLFAKFTTHRGIFHSIPFAIICAELAFILFAASPVHLRWCYAGAVLLGYCMHLAIDETWAAGFFGLGAKRSFGTALKFRTNSLRVTVATYALMLLLGLAVLFI